MAIPRGFFVFLVILFDDSVRALMCAQYFVGLYGFMAALPLSRMIPISVCWIALRSKPYVWINVI